MNDKKVKKQALTFLSLDDLTGLLNDEPTFRPVQIYEWICRGTLSFDEMSNLPMPLRKGLSEKYEILTGEVISELHDRDGTVKLGIQLEDGVVIEAVMLKDGKDRKTACLSTQAGCPLGCVFCKTASLGFKRNLNAYEIAGQFLHLLKREKDISHVVIMGMGEPLLNFDELKKALDFLMDKGGLNISKRRITLSTSGVVSGIYDLANNGPDLRLALSLTTARELLRLDLMPGSRENPLHKVKLALLEYQNKRKRRITLEMVLLAGLNTGPSDVKAAVEFAKGLNVVYNIIQWNPVDGLQFDGFPLKTPEPKEAAEFAAALEKEGLKTTMRIEKGKNICGACGQLGFLSGSPT